MAEGKTKITRVENLSSSVMCEMSQMHAFFCIETSKISSRIRPFVRLNTVAKFCRANCCRRFPLNSRSHTEQKLWKNFILFGEGLASCKGLITTAEEALMCSTFSLHLGVEQTFWLSPPRLGLNWRTFVI